MMSIKVCMTDSVADVVCLKLNNGMRVSVSLYSETPLNWTPSIGKQWIESYNEHIQWKLLYTGHHLYWNTLYTKHNI